MLMDEPLSSLDVARKREILPHIEKLPKTFGVPVLYVTHNVDEVARLANDVVLLAGGKIVGPWRASRTIFERSDLGDFTGGLEAGVVLRGPGRRTPRWRRDVASRAASNCAYR